MALIETFSTSSVFLKICMVLMPLQTLVYMIGFSTEYWVNETVSSIDLGGSIGNVDISAKVYEGLWKAQSCVMNQCSTGDIPNVEGWLHATRFFATIGLIGFLVTTVGVFVCLFVKALSDRRITHILNVVVAAATAVCVLVAVIIYGVHYSDPDGSPLVSDGALYWSFGLCVTALVLDVISTILLVLHLILTKP